MKHLLRHIPLTVGLLLMAAIFLFFHLCYPYHLHYYEQMQMFQFSQDYFLETISLPGGFADYFGRFLTQFFHISWAGALIMTLLFGGVYASGWKAIGLKCEGNVRFLGAILMLLPMRFLWVNACDENAMPALYVALILSLLATWGLRKVGSHPLRHVLSLLLYPLLYWVAGPLAMLFSLLMAAHDARRENGVGRIVYPVAWLLLAVFTPAIAHHWVNWPLENLFLGLRYFRFTYIQLPYIWEAVAAILLIDIIFNYLNGRKSMVDDLNPWVVSGSMMALMMVLCWFGVKKAYRPNNEVAMKYDAMVLEERWDDILNEAKMRTPKHPACLQCINLAMAMTGQMGDMLFRCPQPGTDALLPQFTINFSRPLTAGQIYFNLGWTNTAQRFVFEAQESIPDYQKSARCYKLLAQTHIIRGDKALARKYLKKLQKTLFYDDWADEQMTLLADPDPKALAHHPLYGPMMRGEVRDDYFFSPDMLNMLGNYCTTTPHNRVATQYLLALALVQRKLETFVSCYNLSQYLEAEKRVPLYFQQALALDWLLKHNSLDGIPYAIDQRIEEGLTQFMADRKAQLPDATMQKKYIFTYWYHHFSGEEEQVPEEAISGAGR